MNNSKGKRAALLFILVLPVLIMITSPVLATKTYDPVFKPSLAITRVKASISIDGNLNDPGWKKAGKVTNFVERNPGDNLPPLVNTETYVTYDDKNLYVAFVCLDNPANIRATMCQRDQFGGDDAVGVFLDTYGDANWAYEFYVNPYGVQKDLIWTNVAGEDQGFDLIWESAAKITDSGYQVEIAVPFASIRFPNQDTQSWRMDFYRNHPRESFRQYSWAAYDRNEQCWPCQWGSVDGIEKVKPGKGLEVMPTLISNQSGGLDFDNDGTIDKPAADAPFDNSKIDGEFSLGAKYSVNSDVTLEATYNPDFSQIEADATQIDVNTTVALFFPERRPFFQEGRDIFRTLFNSFYTRTINDPQFAMKLVGRTENYRFGLVSAVDDNSYYIIPGEESTLDMLNVGKSYVNVFRAMRSFGNSTQLGFILNDRRYEAGGYNTIAAVDQNIRLSRNYRILGQYIATFTEEPNKPDMTHYTFSNGSEYDLRDFVYSDGSYNAGFDGESYTGFGFITQFRRNGRHYNMFIDYNQVGHEYRTETGYDPWVNYRNLSMWNGYNIYFSETSIFNRMTPQIYIDNRWTFEGDRKWTHVNTALETSLNRAQTYISLNYNYGTELWYGNRFNDIYQFGIAFNSQPFAFLQASLNANYGTSVSFTTMDKGKETGLFAALTFKPFDRLIIEPNINFYKIDDFKTGEEIHNGYVTRTRIRYQATKALSLRMVFEHDDFNHVWNIDPLITYRISPFSVFYIGSSQKIIDYGNSDYDGYFYGYDKDSDSYFPTRQDFDRGWRLDNRQFFMKLQYLFQT